MYNCGCCRQLWVRSSSQIAQERLRVFRAAQASAKLAELLLEQQLAIWNLSKSLHVEQL
jgi:hypothetical protein